MSEEACRICWRNCGVQADVEMLDIDKMEDGIALLDEQTTRIRELITRFEACYHEADKEAERIVEAIGSGRRPKESSDRPPGRKKELENCLLILSRWCEDPSVRGMDLDVGGIPADELLNAIGQASSLKIWQVQRIIDKVVSALDSSRPHHNLVLDLGDYGEPGANPAGQHYKDNTAFLEQTKASIIHDTVDDRKASISLAMAIDMLMPCNWDFVGAVAALLKAIGGELKPEQPYVCHARNLRLSPLYERLVIFSDTLGLFWKGKEPGEDIDCDLLTTLGEATPVKRWLAASMDKTIRLQLQAPPDFWLQFS